MKIINKIEEVLIGGGERTATVKKNAIASIAIKGISIIVSLLLVPMTLGYVSKELYGVWLILSSIIIWLNFFDVGFTLGLKNKLAEAIAEENWDRGKDLVSTTYVMMICIFIPLCVIFELAIPYINWAVFLNVDAIYNNQIRDALYVMAACVCFNMIVNVFTAVVVAFQKVALSSLFPVIGNCFAIVVIFILTKCCPPSLLALALTISIIPSIIIIIASLYFYNKVFSRVSPSLRCFKKKYVKDIFSLGYKFFLIQIQVLVLYQSTNILISNVSGPIDVTTYNIAYKYLSVAMMLFNIILAPLWPAFTDAYTKKDFKWMNNIYRKLLKIYVASVGFVVLLVALSPTFYHIWIGGSVNVPMIMTISVAAYVLIYSWDSLQVIMINGIGVVSLQTYVTLIGLILHIPMSLFFGNFFGAIGVVISMIVVNIIYSSFFTVQIRKILKGTAKGIWLK